MSRRRTVLVFVRYFLPGYKSGGPIRTIANLVAQLGGEYKFRIVTLDRDATDDEPYSGVERDAWTAVGGAEVWYCSPEGRGLRALARVVRATPHEIAYLNSFFDTTFSIPYLILRRIGVIPGRPVILAPRGQFSESALALGRVRKRAYLRLAKMLGLMRGVIWQASSEFEERDIRAVVAERDATVVVAPNLPGETSASRSYADECVVDSPTRVVFLSRISPMKNLDGALRILASVNARVDFDIYGPVRDPEYWADCLTLIEQLPPNIRATYKGGIPHEDVRAVLSRYDLFFLPTLGENFGHAIVEALQAGTPVLISDRTPWRDLYQRQAGWVIPLDDGDAFGRVVESFASIDPSAKAEWRRGALLYATALADSDSAIGANRALFSHALS